MTRADKIKEYVKERYGVELNDQEIEDNHFTFAGCDGFDCPLQNAGQRCKTCRYYKFWEQEDKEDFDHERFYNFLLNTIQPNEMEKYRSMFFSSGDIVI